MLNIGGGELLVILLIALIVLGPQKLPEAARTVGRVMRELQRLSSGFQQEFQKAIDDEELNTDQADRPSTWKSEAVPLASVIDQLDADDDKRQPGGGEGDASSATAGNEGAEARSEARSTDGNGHRPEPAGEEPAAPGASHRPEPAGQGPATPGDDGIVPEVGQALDEIVAAADANATANGDQPAAADASDTDNGTVPPVSDSEGGTRQ
jgi:sec-independent protein translocase protein TatB